jgi:TPP-dependent 2-oxoacid decarboxylase
MSVTVIEHVLARLRAIGITDVFGVPGENRRDNGERKNQIHMVQNEGLGLSLSK